MPTDLATKLPISLILDAPCKVNLYLHVFGQRQSGYHDLSSLVVFVDLCDVINIKFSESTSLKIDGPFASDLKNLIPQQNLAFRATKALTQIMGMDVSFDIQMTKNIPVAAAVSTHRGWKKRVLSCVNVGVDMIVVDTSDAHNEFTAKVIEDFKGMETGLPICVGNVITYDGAKFLMEKGADVVKVGMSSGSICTTQREKATGRSPMTALLESSRAQEDYVKKTGTYVPLVIDGGVSSAGDMIIALTVADVVMMGGYFNHFYEAAGEKLDENMQLTNHEPEIRYIATWGEGSARARNLDRYGHVARKTFFTEGEEGTVENWGRLKPKLKQDIRKIKAALSNAGCMNLGEFRKESIIELMSTYSQEVVGSTHNMQVKE